ncbi:MAG: DUF1993 family protein [Caulobacterales bacterium]
MLRLRVVVGASPPYLTSFAIGDTPLSLSFYDTSIAVYQRMLGNLSHFLAKAETFAAEQHVPLSTLAEAGLGHGMFPLARQVQLASDAAKGGGARLAGVEAPAMPDTETTFPELKERIARTVAFLETIKREQVDGQEGREIVLTFPGRTMEFTGESFLLTFSLPNFLFHVTTVYAILRSQGVPLGKMDFLAGAQTAA